VADLTREVLQRLARLGAKSRLEELRREEASIRRAFPDLFAGGRGRTSSKAGGSVKRRRGMSAAARKAVSARMKKYWAARRKAAK
jgi:DNA-binding phage protein